MIGLNYAQSLAHSWVLPPFLKPFPAANLQTTIGLRVAHPDKPIALKCWLLENAANLDQAVPEFYFF